MRYFPSILRSLMIFLVPLIALPLATAAQPLAEPEQQLHDHLQHLDREVSRSLQRGQESAVAGDSPATELSQKATRLRRHLRQLEAKVRGWDSPRRQAMLERLRALGLAVGNLEAAAAALRQDPDALASSRWPGISPLGGGPPAKGAPANDDCADAPAITDGISIGDTSNAITDGSASCGDSSYAPDVWFKLTPAITGRAYINTFGSDFDTVLSVHSSCPAPLSYQIRCNDNQSGFQSALDFYAEAGTEYTLRVAGFAGASGAFQLEVGPGGTVSGSANVAASGDPIALATVTVVAEDGYPQFSAVTGADGRYAVAGLEHGSYRAFIQDSAPYVPESYDGLPCPGICDPEVGMLIEVGSSTVTEGIDFALDLGGSIAGTVHEAGTGEPIPSAWVQIWNDRGPHSLAQVLTDDSGHYAAGGLAAGSYFATASSSEHLDELYDGQACPGGPTYGCEPADGEPIQVVLGMATAEINFALDRLGAISGVVTDAASGEPAAFVDVRVFDDHGNPVGSESTDGGGRYTVGGLPPGTYFARTDSFTRYVNEIYDGIPCLGFCDPTTGTPIAVASGVRDGIDFALDLPGAITGTVTEAVSGEPVREVRVFVWNDQGDYEARADVNASGDYHVGELAPGSYFVTTDSEDGILGGHRYLDELYDDVPCFSGAPTGCDPTTGKPVVVSTGTATAFIDFALEASGTISGAVTAEATGEPLSDVQIVVFDQTGDYLANIDSEAGVYTIFGLSAGSYFVGAISTLWVDEIYDDIPCEDSGCVPLAGASVVVAFGASTEGIDFALVRDGAIAGTVTRAETGGELVDYRVELYDEHGSLGNFATTDASGGYQFSGLSAGSYFVRTRGFAYGSDGLRYRDEAYDDLPCPIGCDPTTGTPVAVADEGITAGIDFTLDLLGSISGTVTDATTGAPIDDAVVVIYTADGSALASVESDSSGAFMVVGAPVGNLFALALKSGYAPELYAGRPCTYDCDVTVGTPIAVSLGQAVAGIDFALDFPGSISGTVTNVATGHPLHRVEIEVWDGNGHRVDRAFTDPVGGYLVEPLAPGHYFVTARAEAFFAELYPGLPCPYATCDPTTGTPVPVSHGTVTGGIDFDLTLAGVVSGRVTDAATGEDLFADVVLWDANGDAVRSQSDHGRYAFTGLNAGTYYISTIAHGYHGQLHDRISCPDGPPVGCDPTSGTPLTVTDDSYERIDFALNRRCDGALCLNRDRFRVDAVWQDFDGNTGPGQGLELTDESGYLWFFDDDNVEVVVKVLDACDLPGFNSFWVFAGGLTNVAAELTVTDTLTGEIKTYANPLGAPFQPIQDTDAFATCDAGRSFTPRDEVGQDHADFERQLAALVASSPAHQVIEKSCSGDPALCLAGGRFQVEARWRTQQGETGVAEAVQLTAATGYFWFFDSDNVEVVVKMLDACDLEGFRNYWFFAAGLTDIEVTLTVTDTESGEVQEYMNPLGAAFQPLQDTGSFRTCP